MRVPFRLDGAEELRHALGELPKATKRNALMRVLRKEIEPLAGAVKAGAPYKFGDLKANLFTGTKLTRRQRSMAGDMFRGLKATAELHFGTADPAGMMEEFGLGHNAVHPFFRPEWEGRKRSILDGIGRTLGDEIVAAGVRAARRKAKR